MNIENQLKKVGIEVISELDSESIKDISEYVANGICKKFPKLHFNYEELLHYIDLVLLDVKHTNRDGYKDITGCELEEVEHFIDACNKLEKRIWIRQVVVPGIMDNEEYLDSLVSYLKHIDNIEKIEFLPFHRLGREKYIKLNIPYPYEEKKDMDKDKCKELYEMFMSKYEASK